MSLLTLSLRRPTDVVDHFVEVAKDVTGTVGGLVIASGEMFVNEAEKHCSEARMRLRIRKRGSR